VSYTAHFVGGPMAGESRAMPDRYVGVIEFVCLDGVTWTPDPDPVELAPKIGLYRAISVRRAPTSAGPVVAAIFKYASGCNDDL
jgi:hypothetical protein